MIYQEVGAVMSGSCDMLASRSAKQLLTHVHDETAQGIKVFSSRLPTLGPELGPSPLILPIIIAMKIILWVHFLGQL